MSEENPIPEAMKTLKEAIRRDYSYGYSWWCNLVMPVIDAGGAREVAEDAASQIMFSAFGFKAPPEWRRR